MCQPKAISIPLTFALLFTLLFTGLAYADCRGCCSGHGGVVCRDGVTKCADGTSLSYKCSSKGCSKCGSSSPSIDRKPNRGLSGSSSSRKAETDWTGQVVAIADGDTITVMHRGAPEKIRLYGIDTPEKDQKFGSQARIFTFQMVNAKKVKIIPTDRDRYGRTIGWVYVDGKCVNEELLRNGLAWHYKKYSSDRKLADLENSARRRKVGLWSDPNSIPPWEHRHSKR